MDKTTGYRIFSGFFLFLLCIPLAGMLFYQRRDVSQKQALAPFPDIRVDGGWNVDFLPELGDYFSSHFAFRWEMIEANSLVKGKLFGMSGEDSVIQGRDGYYFYKDSLDSYLGRTVLDEREIYGTARTLALIQEYVEGQGGKFVFTVAPNKNTLYPQYMPYYYRQIQEEGDLERLQRELESERVVYADLAGAFSSEDEVLYHRLDSHWNNKGAALAMSVVLDTLGKKHTDYSELPYEVRRDFDGDLYEMVFPLGKKKDENIYYEKEFSFSYGEGFDSTEDMAIYTTNPGKKQGVVVLRDSFGNSLTPFLAEEYGKGYFSRTVPYPVDALAEEHADTLIFEIVERHLNILAREAPQMPAPVRDFQEWGQEEAEGQTMEVEEDGDYIKVHGLLAGAAPDVGSEVYVRFVSADTAVVYEAFPLNRESSGEDAQGQGAYGYGMYVLKGELEPGTYILEVLCKSGGAWVTSGYINSYTV